MKLSGSFQQAPVRNESVIGAQVYSHSGEFSPQVFDLELPARGVSLQFVRKYRSAHCQEIGPLGRGWTFTYAKRIEQDGDDILYHDGFGRVHRFAFSSTGGGFLSPNGFYAVLSEETDRFLLEQRLGNRFVFERPASGGRLLAIEDRNGNALRFEYLESQILITDPFGRHIEITLEQGRVVALSDHAQRTWHYIYNQDACLTEVIQPSIHGVADRPRVRYTYDETYRLVSITDPKGQTFLQNLYDEHGRIKQQNHGDGTIEFNYEPVDTSALGFSILRTHVRLKNGGLLSLKHDALGHVVERTLFVSASSLPPEDRNGVDDGTIPLSTTSRYNRHSELTLRTYPAGNAIEWVYDQDNEDPQSRGNLLQVTRIPAKGSTDETRSLTTHYTYESAYQQVASVTDPRGHLTRYAYDAHGNLSEKAYPPVTVQELSSDANQRSVQQVLLTERFEYNDAGQIVRVTDPRGATTEYFYYPPSDPIGATTLHDMNSLVQTAGGYLARVVQDPAGEQHQSGNQPATLVTGYGYDDLGNVTTILDGKGNATRLQYDAHNLLVRITSRQPFEHTTSFRYDPNGNMVEGTLSFDHPAYDEMQQQVVFKTTTIHHGFEYNSLNNVVRRTIGTDDRELVRTFTRDAAENIVRETQPMGNVIENSFDERNQVVARRLAVDTADNTEVHHAYTLSGNLASTTDGPGNTHVYHYDGLQRYAGFTNAGGTTKRQWRDEAGNVIRIEVSGESVSFDEEGQPMEASAQSLLESWFEYDELNRRVRIDRAWRDALTGEPLGRSQWDGKEGVVSQLVQYANNHLPTAVWMETGNVVQLQYDAANRVRTVTDETGELVSIDYDENSNPIRVERVGPLSDRGEQFHQVINQQFDELDRLIARSVNEDRPETFSYNALGSLIEYRNPTGASIHALYDTFGRLTGGMTTSIKEESIFGEATEQTILERVEWNDNNRVTARVNARGHATRYQYDALNRLNGVVYADGAIRQLERDASGNIIGIVEPNRTVITNRFDALNRLVERQVENANERGHGVEHFHYDGLNRLISAVTNGATTVRRFDSLSRLLEETQSDQKIRYDYDSAGNQVYLGYPGGQGIYKTYDVLGRIVEVRGQDGVITSYIYNTSTQYREQQFGEMLKVTYTYEPGKDWLSSIVYQSLETGEIIEGRQYRYDAVGNCIQEVQLRRGSNSGERYFYDSANRLIKVQYGVKSLSDPNSPFEQEVLYELGPTGIWQRRTTRDARGQIIEQVEGDANQRERYLSLGNRRFVYDANGNRIWEEYGENGDEPHRRYTYDHANRLVGVESLNADGQAVQTIMYAYDAFSRQVLKRITNDGGTKEHARIWDGAQLIRELEDGKPTKEVIYAGENGAPIQVTFYSEREPSVNGYYVNGLSSVTGLVNRHGTLVNSYHLDVFGRVLAGSNGEDNHSEKDQFNQNPIIVHNWLWDKNTELYYANAKAYDPTTMEVLSETKEQTSGIQEADKIIYWGVGMGIAGSLLGGVGGMAGGAAILVFTGAGLVFLGSEYKSLLEEKERLQKGKKKGPTGQQGSSSSSGNGTQQTGNQQGSNNDSNQNQEQPQPDRPDITHKRPHTVTVEELPDAPPDAPDKSNMPNPEDGTGEGIDKDWWRSLPGADPLEVAESLRSRLGVDERHGTPILPLGALDGLTHLVGFLTPQPVTVDERGGTVILNLAAMQGDWSSTWESSSDGWGDKPRSMAEALAAPRIRTTAIMSRF